MTVDVDTSIFEGLFSWEGAVAMSWERASAAPGESEDSHQPRWDGPNPQGVVYSEPVTIYGLFRSQDRFLTHRREGEIEHGDAQFTTPIQVRPGYVDMRVRDRFVTLEAVGDIEEGRVFVPSAPARPFIFNRIQRAWRVNLQSVNESQRAINA